MNLRPCLNGSVLKIIAVVSMLCDHCAQFILAPLGLINYPVFFVLSCVIGRMAFPIFAFLMVEGFLHTRHLGRYAFNLGVFALLTTIPWNLLQGGLFSFHSTNVLFTLLLGLLALYGLDRLKGWRGHICVVASLVLAYFLRVDYNILGIITIILLYALRGRRGYQALSFFGCLFHGKDTTGLLFAMPLIVLYNGKRGFIQGTVWKYVFYSVYPLHLLVIYLILRSLL